MSRKWDSMNRPMDTNFGYTNEWRRRLQAAEGRINSSLPASNNMLLTGDDIPNPGLGTGGLNALGLINDFTRMMMSYRELHIRLQIQDRVSQVLGQLQEGQSVTVAIDINRASSQIHTPLDANVSVRTIAPTRYEQELRPADSMSGEEIQRRSQPQLYDADGSPLPADYETVGVEVRKPRFGEQDRCLVAELGPIQQVTTKFRIFESNPTPEVRQFVISDSQLRRGEQPTEAPVPLDPLAVSNRTEAPSVSGVVEPRSSKEKKGLWGDGGKQNVNIIQP